jgi:uncharacterized Zn-binding protein involved in type VI secretion
LGDVSNHLGVIITGAMRTYVNGRPAARMGDVHLCPLHGPTPIVTGDADTIIEGQPSARLGDVAACGAAIITASPDTLV